MMRTRRARSAGDAASPVPSLRVAGTAVAPGRMMPGHGVTRAYALATAQLWAQTPGHARVRPAVRGRTPLKRSAAKRPSDSAQRVGLGVNSRRLRVFELAPDGHAKPVFNASGFGEELETNGAKRREWKRWRVVVPPLAAA